MAGSAMRRFRSARCSFQYLSFYRVSATMSGFGLRTLVVIGFCQMIDNDAKVLIATETVTIHENLRSIIIWIRKVLAEQENWIRRMTGYGMSLVGMSVVTQSGHSTCNLNAGFPIFFKYGSYSASTNETIFRR
jgi:hypothetical protein